EAGHRPDPVGPLAKGAALGAGHFFAILHQARASAAGDHEFAQMREALLLRFAGGGRAHPRAFLCARLRSLLSARLRSLLRGRFARKSRHTTAWLRSPSPADKTSL